MIVKELIEQCPVETVVSEVLTLCCVDENEQTSVRGSYTAFVENLKKRQAVETEHLLLGIKDIEETKEKIEILLYACKDIHRFLNGKDFRRQSGNPCFFRTIRWRKRKSIHLGKC